MSNSLIDDLLKFLNQSPTSWHAVDFIRKTLLDAHFTELHEEDEWKLDHGKGYFVLKEGASLCAFITPHKTITKFHIAASHTDSPSLKLKPNPEFRKNEMTLFATEIYGAPLLTSWLNRDLGIAGRVFYSTTDNKIAHSLVNLKNDPVIIPQLAIHLDRDANEKGPTLNKQDHFSALAALDFESKDSYLLHLLKNNLDESFDYLLSHDLFLYPLEEAKLLGSEMLAGYRLDSLASVHAILSALKTTPPHEQFLNVAVFWNHEEIGSETGHGAASPFLLNVLERISLAFSFPRERFLRLLPKSLCLSVDLAHAINPNYLDKHDARHMPQLSKGPVFKYHAGQRYSSDGQSSAFLIQLCEKHVIPYQFFSSRNDIPCGSTIGPIHAAKTGIPTVDIGSPQLSMHSSREIVSTRDHLEMSRLLSAYYHS
jgi:aspartyl aminopeptidase